jgi:hypothetical protein
MLQVRLADVPGLQGFEDALLSFHYCPECIPWGLLEDGTREPGYDVSVFRNVDQTEYDGMGIVSELNADPCTVSFRDFKEVPGIQDRWRLFPSTSGPGGASIFDEDVYPESYGFEGSQLGGWPSWDQTPCWPESEDGEVHFVGQLDFCIPAEGAIWMGGGHAMLFLTVSSHGSVRAEYIAQTT